MAEIAYQLERFAPREKEPPVRVRVAPKTRSRSKGARQILRMVRVLVCSLVMVVLVCGLLYTQASITELQGQISDQQKALTEEEALYNYLSYELEGVTNIRNVEQRAAELGLAKVNANQLSYVRVADGEKIEVKESGLDALLNKARTGLLNTAERLEPLPADTEEEETDE